MSRVNYFYFQPSVLATCVLSKFIILLMMNGITSFSDVNYLSAAAPPAAAEWSNLLRPLRGREPEGMWNLLSIVREMFKRNDRNAIPLLEIITEECMACEQVCVVMIQTTMVIPYIIFPSTSPLYFFIASFSLL